MFRNPRRHLQPSSDNSDSPAEITKIEFGRKLQQLHIDRGWNQSDLARAAGLGRDAISTYINGRSFPEPKSLRALADALQVPPDDLLPNSVALAMKQDPAPVLEIRQTAGHPDKVYLRVNRIVSLDQAAQIFNILKDASE
jgi:transcriptional regulator with XRE-family HTH domain